jgi:hypothetical protein
VTHEFLKNSFKFLPNRFIAERHLYLGPDLAAAHFLVHRGAAVKFIGNDVWFKRDDKGRYSLPGTKVPG